MNPFGYVITFGTLPINNSTSENERAKRLGAFDALFLSENSCSMGAIFQERTKGDEKVTRALKEKRKMEGKENGHCDV